MHGLVNKALETFLVATFGRDRWQAIVLRSGLDLGDDGFDSMRLYEGWQIEALLAGAVHVLDRSRESLLEDLGIFLICNPGQDSVRRLMRFGGGSFSEFLLSLDDLPARTRLAVPDLGLPDLTVIEDGPGRFHLECRGTPSGLAGVGHVCVGVLRALADDYGVLAVIEHRGSRVEAGAEHPPGGDTLAPTDRRRVAIPVDVLSIVVHDPDYQPGRRFDLALSAA